MLTYDIIKGGRGSKLPKFNYKLITLYMYSPLKFKQQISFNGKNNNSNKISINDK